MRCLPHLPAPPPPQRLSPLRHVPRPLPSQTTGPRILDARRDEGHQGAGGGHVLHHGPQGPAGRPLDELAGVPHLLEQAAGDLFRLLVHILLQGQEKFSQGADGQVGHLGAEVGDLGERWEGDPARLLGPAKGSSTYEEGTLHHPPADFTLTRA